MMPTTRALRAGRRTALLLALVLSAPIAAQSVTIEALLPNTVVLKVDGERKTLRVGDNFRGIVLISADSSAAVLEINGERQRLGLNRNVTTNYVAPERRQLDIPRNERMQYITSAEINGRSVRVIVDTGANVVAMNASQATALGIDYRAGVAGNMETASDVVAAWSVNLQSVAVGGIRIENVRASVTEGKFPATILLGMSYLQHVELREADGVLSLSRAW
ncbi:retropepsin-like aspartic protease family protein [Kineobactrum salinum]|uniref:TIGR02281 family clan AA aspartic protease n=1 Tax=Kineobactrum salinum TaxID=2708301 RepID=A0A6C0U1Y1_9GAMM|nr:TIGR02281 family clan AA aspartic protease [Kineobactrum salinum]QIB66152.1 TIGR02281 family clan AA aspartic protease [Kineobactrum salinum]